MISDLLKHPNFPPIFSFLLGVALACVARPICKGAECLVNKAPPVKEWDGYVYRIGNTCHQYATEIVDCPAAGQTIESFKQRNTIITKRE